MGAPSVGWGSSDEDAEVHLGLHMFWDRVCSVLGENVTHFCFCLHPLWVNKETWAHFASGELIKPMEVLLYSRTVTIGAQNPWELP